VLKFGDLVVGDQDVLALIVVDLLDKLKGE
jgi:hypothetical protein